MGYGGNAGLYLLFQRVPRPAVGTAAAPLGIFSAALGTRIDGFGFRRHISSLPFCTIIPISRRNGKGHFLTVMFIFKI